MPSKFELFQFLPFLVALVPEKTKGILKTKKGCFKIPGALILVATGVDPFTDKCQVLDMSNTSNTCSHLPSYPLLVYRASGGILNGSPTICGGYRKIASPVHQTDSCYLFDRITNSWKLHCNMQSRRYEHASAVVNGALFVTGGIDDSGNMASTELIFANGTVISGTNLPEARRGHCMVELNDGKVMILGAAYPAEQRKNVIIFDPVDNSYTNGPSLSADRTHPGCTIFKSPMHNDRPVVLAAGGHFGATAELYDYTFGNQWEPSIHFI